MDGKVGMIYFVRRAFCCLFAPCTRSLGLADVGRQEGKEENGSLVESNSLLSVAYRCDPTD